jgi:SPP1 family predicted phage head-tail adaptor
LTCDKYNAGMLREPITIERRSLTSDGAGGYSEAWTTLTTTRAYVKAVSGSERYASDRLETTTRWRIAIRYIAGLRESDRIVFRSKKHNIRFINNLELRDRWMEIDVDGGAAT